MYLKSINIENIACFQDASISFLDEKEQIIKWTVILGENGTGKSSILKSIALALSEKIVSRDLVPNPKKMIRWGTNNAKIEAEIQLNKTESMRIETKFSADEQSRGWEEDFSTNRGDYDNLMYQNKILLCGYGATRITPKTKSTYGSFKELRTLEQSKHSRVVSLFNEDVIYLPIDEWLAALEYSDLKFTNEQTKLDRAIDSLNKILLEIQFKEINRDGVAIFITPYGETPLSELSRGYQDVITWVSDLMRQMLDMYKDLDNPLEGEGIVLVEEIALHLHPVWQQKVITFLKEKFPNIQFIVTTHSPLVVQSLEANEYVILEQSKTENRYFIAKPNRYTIDPRSLTTNQLITSPIFGLHTAKSLEVQSQLDEISNLRNLLVHGKASDDEIAKLNKILLSYSSLGALPGESFEDRVVLQLMDNLLIELGREDLSRKEQLNNVKRKYRSKKEV